MPALMRAGKSVDLAEHTIVCQVPVYVIIFVWVFIFVCNNVESVWNCMFVI